VRLERGSSGSIGVQGFRKALLKITNEEIEEMKRKNFVSRLSGQTIPCVAEKPLGASLAEGKALLACVDRMNCRRPEKFRLTPLRVASRLDVLPTAGLLEETYELTGEGFRAVVTCPFGPGRGVRRFRENHLALAQTACAMYVA
jgi:hypothetical protein